MAAGEPRIDRVRAAACTVPTDQHEGDGTLAWDSTTVVLVEVESGGTVGTGFTYAPVAACRVVEDLLAPVVRGGDARSPRDAYRRMSRAVRNAGRSGLVMMALSAVDVALWDLAARLHDLPLTRLWGSAPSEVEVYGSGGFTTYDDDRLRDQLTQWLALGLTRGKIKIGESWGRAEERDLQRTALARQVLGESAELFVDANGGYSVGQARRVGKTLDDLGVTWFEEPVSSEDRDGLLQVRRSVRADVTAGEYAHDVRAVALLADSVDCIQADVTRCGGYTGWFAIAGYLEGAHRDLSGHCAPYLTLPAASATSRVRHLEWFHDHVRIEQSLFDGAPDPVDGRLTPSDAPGHGLSVRRDVLDAHRVA